MELIPEFFSPSIVALSGRRGPGELEQALQRLLSFECLQKLTPDPCTRFLSQKVAMDINRFVLTGATVSSDESPFGTSVPGVFAVGDVRSGSVKRVASAVGEGSVVIAAIHKYLASTAYLSQTLQDVTYAH